MIPTKTKPTCGRIVHVYSDRWDGPRPGIVVSPSPSSDFCANVNVLADGEKDRDYLQSLRASPSGNTIKDLPVWDLEQDETLDVKATLKGPLCGVYAVNDTITMRAFAVWPPRV